jgi:hypothetical protein
MAPVGALACRRSVRTWSYGRGRGARRFLPSYSDTAPSAFGGVVRCESSASSIAGSSNAPAGGHVVHVHLEMRLEVHRHIARQIPRRARPGLQSAVP